MNLLQGAVYTLHRILTGHVGALLRGGQYSYPSERCSLHVDDLKENGYVSYDIPASTGAWSKISNSEM